MRRKINKENIRPLAVARGPRLESSHIDTVAAKWLKQVMQRTGLILHRYHDGGFIITTGWHHLAANNQKAR